MTAVRRDPAVDRFFDARVHLMRVEIDRLRDVVLAADPRILDTIKSLPDPRGLLSGEAEHVRTARFRSAAIDHAADALTGIVRAFCDTHGGTDR